MPPPTGKALLLLPFQLIWVWSRVFFCYFEEIYKMIFPPDPKSLKGKVILITGAGGGIGSCTCMRFAKYGARLALLDMNLDSVKALAAQIQEEGGVAHAYKCDITDVSNVQSVASQVKRDVGEVDILVNNAGIMDCASIFDVTESQIRRNFEVNTISHFWTLKEFLPTMYERNEGHIVTIASMAGRVGTPLLSHYCGSKWAVTGIAEAISEEFRVEGKTGIKFTTVFPSFCNTYLVNHNLDKVNMNNRFGNALNPDDVAEAIVEGVRRDQIYVYVPPEMSRSRIFGAILPRKATKILTDFVDAKFVYKK